MSGRRSARRIRTRLRQRIVNSKPYGAWLYYSTGRRNGWPRLATLKLMRRFWAGL